MLFNVFRRVFQSMMTQSDSPGLEIDLHKAIVSMSCDLLTAVQSVLRPSPLPGRQHYLFTLNDITKCFQVSCVLRDLQVKASTSLSALFRGNVTNDLNSVMYPVMMKVMSSTSTLSQSYCLHNIRFPYERGFVCQ